MKKIIGFFGPNNPYGEFSNFYPCTFKAELGMIYKYKFEDSIQINNSPIVYDFNCVEQYFMAYKALLFEPYNLELFSKIMNETDPKKIKKLGRQVKNFDKVIWDDRCVNVMRLALHYKFTQNQHLKELLLSTGDAILVEASPFDRKWGVGCGLPKALDQSNWWGKNLLGQLLMDTRHNLRVPI